MPPSVVIELDVERLSRPPNAKAKPTRPESALSIIMSCRKLTGSVSVIIRAVLARAGLGVPLGSSCAACAGSCSLLLDSITDAIDGCLSSFSCLQVHDVVSSTDKLHDVGR